MKDSLMLMEIEKLFLNPTKEYRGEPFWAWNGALDKEELQRQIDVFSNMGFGGFFMHSRGGLSTEYLGSEFMDDVRHCVNYAKQNNMFASLYDEDRWPSGFAGGYVTQNELYRMKRLCFTQKTPNEMLLSEYGKNECNPYLLTVFDIIFDEKNRLLSYSQIAESSVATGEKWYVYIVNMPCCGYHNGYTYADTMNPEAIDKFIEVTHEAYKREVGNEFNKTIPAIFTDEPNYGRIFVKEYARDGKDVLLPWTQKLKDKFLKDFGYSIIDKLPELIWNLSNDAPSHARYAYYRLASELLASSYADKIGFWCENNGIALTGHMLDEVSISSQVCAVGEVMRCLRGFTKPGVDMLCNAREFTTVKQAQSVAHQCGREGVTSELYGVTGWDFDFRGHKFQGDWQAALGVTLRVPHLAHMSLCGSGKRDYPASINYQSSWCNEYSYIEDHFARINVALTRGKSIVKVGVIHPVESGWLMNGCREHCSDYMDDIDEKFLNITQWLIRGQIDFDYISESMLEDLYALKSDGFTVGDMTYEMVFVPPLYTIRSTTIEALLEFINKGGKVIVSGQCPHCIDGKLSSKAETLWQKSQHVMFYESSIINALEKWREIEIRLQNGLRCKDMIYSLRADGENKWLFIAHCDPIDRTDGNDCACDNINITIRGKYFVSLWNTLTGETNIPVETIHQNGNTIINLSCYKLDSFLFLLTPTNYMSKSKSQVKETKIKKAIDIEVPDEVEYSLSEDNVLVLDMCEWSRDGVHYNKREEILRIDSIVRHELGLPLANNEDTQPWKYPSMPPSEFIYLKFCVYSEIEQEVHLAFENASSVIFNGKEIDIVSVGYYVDRGIKLIRIGKLLKGKNELIVKAPISARISLENMFIIGKFGVKTIGTKSKIISLPDNIAFDSITKQGMSFYGGNITYKIPFKCNQDGELNVKTDYYNGALISVKLDGKNMEKIVIPPYSIKIPNVNKGQHVLELTLFGTRINTFGALHLTAPVYWKGPNMWYTKNNLWSYEYRLKEIGIMKKPELTLQY